MTERIFNRPETRITAVYLLVAGLWVLCSDLVLDAIVRDQRMTVEINLIKGWLFVAVTGAILFVHLRREFGLRFQLEDRLSKQIDDLDSANIDLQASELRFRRLIEEAPTGIFVQTNRQFAILNPAALQMFGARHADELLNTPVLDRFDPAYHEQIQRRIKRTNEDRRAVPAVEETIVRLDSSSFTAEISAVPFHLAGQDGALVFFNDITERRRLEDALRESELRFRQLAENINEVFFLRDAVKRQMLYISPAYESIWGRSCESLYQNPVSFVEAIHPDDRDEVVATFERQRRGERIEVSYRVVRPDRTIRWIRSRAFPIRDDDGAFRRIAGIAEDITEQVRYENQLRRLSQQLVKALDEDRTRIARDLHDRIGQQLTGLSLSLAAAQTTLPDDHPAATILGDSTEAISAIIEQLRNIIADTRPLVLEDMGLAAGLRWYCEKFTRRTKVPVTLTLPPAFERFTPQVDNTLFHITQEALANVAKYAEASQVAIALEMEPKVLRMTIRDDGKGFDVDAVTDPAQANSWGIQIMQERCQALIGARLNIESDPGKGTTVMVEVQL